MAEPLTLQFAADVSRAQNAMATLAGAVVSNMTTMGAAMSGGAASTNSFGQTLNGLAQNASRAAAAVSMDVRNISAATVNAAAADKATLEGIVRAFTAAAATSNTSSAALRAGLATTTASVSTITAQIPSLSTLLSLFIAFGAAAIVFESVAASIEAARKHVEDFVKVGRDAERLGIGAEFFQRATLSAEKYGLTVEQVTAALAKARDASEVRIGEGKDGHASSAIGDRLEQNVRAGNLTAADKATFDQAGSQEARIRAILDLIDKLRSESRDLAAFDLAGKFFGADFERQLRNGVDLTKQLRDTLNSTSTTVAGVRIVGEDEVERARQLDDKAKDIANTFATALAPIQRDISNAVLDTYQAFLDVEAVIARVVQIAVNLYSQITGIIASVKDFVNQVPVIGKMLTAGNVVTFLQEAGRAAGIIDPEVQGPNAPLAVKVRPRGPDRSATLPSLAAPRSRKGSDSDSLDAVETLINQLEKARDTAKAELENVEKTNVEREKAVALAKAEAAAREDVKRGKRDDPALTDDERNRVLAAAEAMQKYRDSTKDAEQAIRQAADAARYFGDMAANGLADAVLEGRSFGDVLANLEKQLARSALQAIFTGQGPLASLLGTAPTASSGDTVGGIAGLLKGGLGSFGGGGGALQGPTLSGATLDAATGGSGILGFLGGLFRANGGPVQAGMPYTVGEMGREMFIPNQNGRIVPIESGPGGGGGGGTTYIGGDTISIAPAGGVTFEQMAAFFAARDQRLQRDLPMLTARAQSRFGVPKR